MGIRDLEIHSLQRSEHALTRERFDNRGTASRYAEAKNARSTWKNRRELQCIAEALTGTPPGSRVLDLPTGTGRLLPMLLARGFQVLAADYSEHMLGEARAYCRLANCDAERDGRIEFARLDVMSTGLPDRSIDVTICNRLLHHYPSNGIRRRVLGELARITRERIIVSYFSNVAVSAVRFHFKQWLWHRVPTDRIPIWPEVMTRDAEFAGLTVQRVLPVRFGFSPQTYVLLQHAGDGTCPGSAS